MICCAKAPMNPDPCSPPDTGADSALRRPPGHPVKTDADCLDTKASSPAFTGIVSLSRTGHLSRRFPYSRTSPLISPDSPSASLGM